MHLGLGPTNLPLQDGFASWNASAADALAIWNGYLDFIDISAVSEPSVAQACGDGINSVFFSNTIFGDTFDDSTIAITILNTTDDPKVTAEGDVIVNTAFRYDSYRGPQQSDSGGDIVDFHRVVLHEFGHVLGLDHEENDPPGQSIMEPFITDLDHLGGDDAFGIRALYQAKMANLYGEFEPRVGDSFSYFGLGANNSPTSFSATGLPAGVTINPTTGTMAGKVTTPGEYNPVVTAHGPVADAYGSIKITVWGLNQVPGLLEIIKVDAASLLADPIRPRLYAAGEQGINMIDTDNYAVTQLVSGNQRPANLSFSPDNSLLFYREEADPTLHRVDLESLDELSALTIPIGYGGVVEGLENRGYSTGFAEVYQLDAATGAVEATFASSINFPQITITPDRRTLIVNDIDHSLSTYDISTSSPVPLSSIDGYFSYPAPAADSTDIYCFSRPNSQAAQLTDFPVPDLVPGVLFGTPGLVGPLSVAPDGSIYECEPRAPGSISVFDPVSLQLTKQLQITHRPFNGYAPFGVAFDHNDPYFYVMMAPGGSTEIWKFSVDFDLFPPPDPIPTKNLLNISTRARVGADEEAMIGGFIIEGPNPKKVLVRGLGPSLPLTGALSNPVLALYNSSGELIATNDNWTSNHLDILASHLPPSSPREAAIEMTLDPGAFTAIIHDVTGQAGQALVEVYDLDPADSLLANISTRGEVGLDDEVMIGGFIIGGVESTDVLVRAIGPSLAALGVSQPLVDPVLELHDYEGTLIATNDNWRSEQQTEIIATGIAPTDDRESAIMATLDPASYTVIVRGQGGTTGVGLVEIYNLGENGSDKAQHKK